LPVGLDALAFRRGGVFRQRFQLRLEVAAEDNVGTTASHVGGDRHRTGTAGLGNDDRLALVLLGIQHLMRNGRFLEQLGQVFRGLDRGGADEYWLAALVAILDVVDDRVVLVL